VSVGRLDESEESTINQEYVKFWVDKILAQQAFCDFGLGAMNVSKNQMLR
jgi:hypothetical protein